jgi:hypothetical protein
MSVGAILMVLLAGCGGVEGDVSSTSDSPIATSESVDPQNCQDPQFYEENLELCAGGGEPSPEAASPPTSAAAVNPRFGETYEYEDGLSLTISAPQPYTPSDSAAVGEPVPTQFVVFEVTIKNGTGGNYDPVSFTATMQSGNTEQQQVFDSAAGIGGTPTTPILPGRESVFRIAFGAGDPNDLVMQVSPGFEYDAVIYTT